MVISKSSLKIAKVFSNMPGMVLSYDTGHVLHVMCCLQFHAWGYILVHHKFILTDAASGG